MINKMIRKKGFTLVELLVVIAVIGVLTTVLMINFVGSRERASDSQKIQNLKSMKNALRMYYNDNQEYPEDGVSDLGSALVTEYMSTTDFNEISDYNGFDYEQLNNGDGFRITVILDSGSGIDWEASQYACGVLENDILTNGYSVCSN